MEGDHLAMDHVDCLTVMPLAAHEHASFLPHSSESLVEDQHPRVTQEGLDLIKSFIRWRPNQIDNCHGLGVNDIYEFLGGGQQ